MLSTKFKTFITKNCLRNASSYVQGQYSGKNIREYFYYIDHQGMDFLVFFFQRIRINSSDRFPDFPYVSLCGRERNYIRCDDTPLVYTHVIKERSRDEDLFCYGQAGDLMYNPFFPDKLYMDPESGRVYHPCQEEMGGIGLVQSKLAVEFSRWFKFRNGEAAPPTQFQWKGKLHELDNEWYFKQKKMLRN